jgi:hypothetical protein
MGKADVDEERTARMLLGARLACWAVFFKSHRVAVAGGGKPSLSLSENRACPPEISRRPFFDARAKTRTKIGFRLPNVNAPS